MKLKKLNWSDYIKSGRKLNDNRVMPNITQAVKDMMDAVNVLIEEHNKKEK
jgi:hypothetical protein